MTSRFYALRNQRPPATLAHQLSGKYLEAQKILVKIRTTESIDVQEDIESLQSDWPSINESEKEIGKVVVEILEEELRQVLTKHQTRAVVQLQREINMKRFFEPERLITPTNILRKDRDEYVRANDDNVINGTHAWEEETETLLAQYQSDENQVIEVRKKIQETSALLSVLSAKAVEQQEMAGSILDCAIDSVGAVDRADDQLKKAIRHNDSFKKYLLWFFWILTVVLWVLHNLT